MRIAQAQIANAGSMIENLKKSVEAIRHAAKNGADIVLFPEVQLTEFFPQFKGQDVRKYRLKIDSDEVKILCQACFDNKIMAVPNIYLEENCQAYDASILISSKGEIIGIQKMVYSGPLVKTKIDLFLNEFYAADSACRSNMAG